MLYSLRCEHPNNIRIQRSEQNLSMRYPDSCESEHKLSPIPKVLRHLPVVGVLWSTVSFRRRRTAALLLWGRSPGALAVFEAISEASFGSFWRWWEIGRARTWPAFRFQTSTKSKFRRRTEKKEEKLGKNSPRHRATKQWMENSKDRKNWGIYWSYRSKIQSRSTQDVGFEKESKCSLNRVGMYTILHCTNGTFDLGDFAGDFPLAKEIVTVSRTFFFASKSNYKVWWKMHFLEESKLFIHSFWSLTNISGLRNIFGFPKFWESEETIMDLKICQR